MNAKTLFALATSCCLGAHALHAGQVMTSASDKKAVIPEEEKSTWFPDDPAGLITVGGLFSAHMSGGFLDSITGLYAPRERDAFLFLDSRYRYEDSGQYVGSTGLGFRKMLGSDVIIGVNGFYDAINSEHDNDYAQGGAGAEVLSKWVDVRFNYYFPEHKEFEVARFHGGGNRLESTLEGYDTEIGFLVPGLDRVAEVRLFGGYYHYLNRFGSDIEGLQARLEARILPGLVADVVYTDDDRLNGGHWTAGVRASVPFSIFALARGHNPFAGTKEEFTFRKREFSERLGEMIMRSDSRRLETTTSNRND